MSRAHPAQKSPTVVSRWGTTGEPRILSTALSSMVSGVPACVSLLMLVGVDLAKTGRLRDGLGTGCRTFLFGRGCVGVIARDQTVRAEGHADHVVPVTTLGVLRPKTQTVLRLVFCRMSRGHEG